jgi:hypothetical protein
MRSNGQIFGLSVFKRESKNKNVLVRSRLVPNVAKPGQGIEPGYGALLQRYFAQIQGSHVTRPPVPTLGMKKVKLSGACMAVFSC